MTFYERTERLVHELKAKLADLENEWDRLDSQGTGTQRQQEITEEMLRVTDEINGFERLLTILKKK